MRDQRKAIVEITKTYGTKIVIEIRGFGRLDIVKSVEKLRQDYPVVNVLAEYDVAAEYTANEVRNETGLVGR